MGSLASSLNPRRRRTRTATNKAEPAAPAKNYPPASATWIAHTLLPRTALDLGTIVLDTCNPTADFYKPKLPNEPETADTHEASNFLTQKLNDYNTTTSSNTSGSMSALLGSLLTMTATSSDSLDVSLSSAQCTSYTLQNSGDLFYNLCKIPEARSWLERALRHGSDAYLVVGIKTVKDATISVESTKERGAGAQVQAPPGLVPVPEVGEPGVSVDLKKSGGKRTEFVAPGEQIWAVQYRKVRFTMFASREVEAAYLEKGNRWKVYLGTRGAGDDAVECDVEEGDVGDGEEGRMWEVQKFRVGEAEDEEVLLVR